MFDQFYLVSDSAICSTFAINFTLQPGGGNKHSAAQWNKDDF